MTPQAPETALTAVDLESEITALCREERPQLYALAAVDPEAQDGGVLAWVLAWEGRAVASLDGRSRVVSYRSLVHLWRDAQRHPLSDNLRLIPLDGQGTPDLD